MNVLNRNMFRNRDSRNRLAQMGGILSSSPELQETAMTFASGGGADLPDYIINVPGLTAEGEYLRISSATLEKLNNAVPEIMANARMVSPVEMVISEGFSSLVANARPGDALVGTRVNRLREQLAASDPSRVPIPPETAQISSAADEFALSNAANAARDNRLARSIAAASNEDLTSPAQLRADPPQAKEMSGDPYAGDIFSDDRIRVRPRENVGGGIEAQDAANFEKEKISAALIESLAPNNAQGQPGGILGAKYPESDMPLTMLNTQRAIESLVKGTPYSGELSPSQTARNQETLRNTLRREEIAQQRADIAEAGIIAQDAADTREAFSVPLESGIAKAVVPESVLSSEQNAVLNAIDEFSLPSKSERVVPTSEAVVPENVLSSEQLAVLNAIDEFSLPSSTKQVVPKKVVPTSEAVVPESVLSSEQLAALNAIDEFSFPSSTKQVVKSPAEELINVSGPLPEAFTGTETENRAADAANAIAALTNTAEPDDLDYSGQVESGTSKEGSTRPPSFRTNADGVFITDDTQDSAVETTEPSILPQEIPKKVSDAPGKGSDNEQAGTFETIERFESDATMDLLKQLDEDTRSRLGTELEPGVAPPKGTSEITPAVVEKIKLGGAEAGLGEKFGGDGSIADLTKDYTKLLKSLLGESDEDKAARKGELFMLMGAALMSGKSSNALTNIGGALQIGAKAAIQDRVTRKKRDDTIGLKGFEMAADRIAKRDAQQLALDKEVRDRQTQLDLIDARLGASKDLASYRAELDALKYTNMGEHKGLNSIFDLAEKGYADVAFDKPKDITLLELFELEARKAKYTQEQINRFNRYYGRTGSGATDGGEGGGQTDSDGFRKK